MQKYFILVSFLLQVTSAISQQASYSDPAAAYLRILIEKSGEGSYQQVGNFKVIGTSYLFGEKLAGNAYTPKANAINTQVSYNTYNQQLDVYQDGQEKPLTLPVSAVDSFRLLSSIKTDFKEDLVFVNSSILDSSFKKCFLQEVAMGKRFSLYKAYKSNLGYVSSNYVQSELRQYDLVYEYYYKDATKPGIKKLKITANNLKKEFSDIADVSTFVNSDNFTTNTEYVLKEIFAQINLK